MLVLDWLFRKVDRKPDIRSAKRMVSEARAGTPPRLGELESILQTHQLSPEDVGTTGQELARWEREMDLMEARRALGYLKEGYPKLASSVRYYLARAKANESSLGLASGELRQLELEAYRRLVAKCRQGETLLANELFGVQSGGFSYEELGTSVQEVHGFLGGSPVELLQRAEHRASGKCIYDLAWVGLCAKHADAGDFCAEHAAKRCGFCGEQAYGECDYATSLVCGRPLCQWAGSCPSHSHSIL